MKYLLLKLRFQLERNNLRRCPPLHLMKQCCTLANPHNTLAVRINQYNRLSQVAGDSMHPNSDHCCLASIPLDLSVAPMAIKNLPMCCKVNVSDSTVPSLPTEATLRYLAELHQTVSSDAIAIALRDKYVGPDTIGVVIDMNDTDITNPPFLEETREIVGGGDMLVILLNYSATSNITNLEGIEKMEKCQILKYCDPSHALYLLQNCNKHILTGSLLGWYGAAHSDNVVYSKPWSPGVQLDFPPSWKAMGSLWTCSRFFSKIYYINLDRRKDRQDHMNMQLVKNSLVATRVVAVDGVNIVWQNRFGVKSNFWNNGAFAYCLSYRVAIIDAIKNNYNSVFIMDDDAVLTDQFYPVLEKAFDTLPANWHMLYLGANHGVPTPVAMPTEKERIGDHLYKLLGSMGSHAIIINKVAYPTILNFLSDPYAPLDLFFSMYQRFFPCYITYPGVAYQLGGHSDIIDKDIDYSKDWGVDYINHIASRVQ